MKRFLLMAVAAMMATMSVNAQFKPGTWSIQPKIGIGLANITNMENVPISTTTIDKTLAGAALIGVEIENQLNDKVGIAFGLNYSVQGCAWENFKIDGVKCENPRIELGYINLPVVANMYLNKGFALKAGVQFGFLTNADIKYKMEGKINGYDSTIDMSLDMKKDLETLDVSIPLGASYESRKHWIFDARYHFGLTKINKEGKTDYKNSVFMISVGYKFKL